MKIKILLTICLLQPITVSVFGQFSYSHTDKTVTINGTTINKPQQRTSNYSTRSSSGNVDWGQLVTNVIMQKLLAPNTNQTFNASTYYFDGKYYNSRAERDAAIEKFRIEFEKHKQEILAELKGTEVSDELEFKDNPYEVQQETAEPSRLEEYANSMDLKTLGLKPYFHPMADLGHMDIINGEELKKELIDMGIDVTATLITTGTTVAAGALLTPGTSLIVEPAAKGATQFLASLAHAANHDEQMNFKTYVNALASGSAAAVGTFDKSAGIVFSSAFSGAKTLSNGDTWKEAAFDTGVTAITKVALKDNKGAAIVVKPVSDKLAKAWEKKLLQ